MKDHQGNNRVVVDEEGTVEEVNHYYPFGSVFSSTGDAQPYKYNGKELDRKGGLDWYDYGARMYDAALGRWHVVDPMAEKFYSLDPYLYCANNPILLVDPNGMWPTWRGIRNGLNNALNIYIECIVDILLHGVRERVIADNAERLVRTKQALFVEYHLLKSLAWPN